MNDTMNSDELSAALVGYGQMGREIERLAPANGITVIDRFDADRPLAHLDQSSFQVAIEFTHPDAVRENIRKLVRHGIPVVVGTTGWYDRLEDVRDLVESGNGQVIYGSNYSIGVNIFFRLVREAGLMFNEQTMYDAAVHEIHHIRKADAPGGTAVTLGNILLETLQRKTHLLTETSHGQISPAALHVTSQRLGATIGTHTVAFDSEADTVELVHRARNRSGFALGALLAARWIVAQPPGLYRFEDLF